jgi:phenylalanyl-tRNA synthetase alpha chain
MDDVKSFLETYEKELFEELSKVTNKEQLESFRVKHLSRQGTLSAIMHKLKTFTLEEKKVFGPVFNALKEQIQQAFETKERALQQEKLAEQALREAFFDVTAYAPKTLKGSLHPYTHTVQHLEDIFVSMGFEIVEGPEVETEYHNFEALNIPADHPARDMQDTFWLTLPGLLLRTHTSSVEIHTMLKRKPPVAIAVPGRVYRNEATDASHDFMFMQFEGLYVDKNVSLAHLFATMQTFLQALFERKDLSIRMRPSYYPFVEPGVDIGMSCPFCTQGCAVCKKTRWIEVGGAGLTHPNVLRACNIDPNQWSGFAFGFGLTRLVMIRYGIPDIRLLHANKLDFLKQF